MRVYTKEQYEWIGQNCSSHTSYYSLCDAFRERYGFSNYSSIRSICRRNGFLLGEHDYTEAEIEWIRNNFGRFTTTEMADELYRRFHNRKKPSTLRTFCNSHLGLYFKDGERHREKARERQFVPIGNIVERGGREWVKVSNELLKRTDKALKNYRPRAVVEYERLFGEKVPEGKFVTFLDGNNRNYSKENLIMVDRKVMAKMSKICRFKEKDREFNRTNVMICQLELMAKED